MEVVPGLHWVESIWDTKVYVLFEAERVVLIDAATPGRAGAVWRCLDSMGYPPQAVDEIWLTHGDIDHMGSLAALKAGSEARVVAHQADAPLVEGQADRELGPLPLASSYQRLVNWSIRRLLRYSPVQVDHRVDDGDDLGGWQVVHVPGHTAGSVCFYKKSAGLPSSGTRSITGRAGWGRRHQCLPPTWPRPTILFAGSPPSTLRCAASATARRW